MKHADISTPENKELSIWEALIPVSVLVILLAINNALFGGEAVGAYSNHIILLIGAVTAMIVGLFNKVSFNLMGKEIFENLKSVFIPIIILFLVGALAASWLISGVIPAMVFYGLQVLKPAIFLPASLLICILVSLATGSSWNTAATVGIALVGIGLALNIPSGMVVGAILSGAYFGDKLSPLSDTTNLAPAMAGTGLYTHIQYMLFTTIPSVVVALVVFIILSLTTKTTGSADVELITSQLQQTFVISPWLFLVPLAVILMIFLKIKPLFSLSLGVLLGLIFAFIFQAQFLQTLNEGSLLGSIKAIFLGISIPTEYENLVKLYGADGVIGMLWTIYLIISAMIFGGVMDAIGALSRITKSLLTLAKSTFGLFASTVISCLGLNTIASDQYLAIVIPGKMFKDAFRDRDLAPENLSRTLEDSGTVTSALVPWNTCGAYHSSVLGVGVAEYFIYAVFNYVSPFMTLLVAALNLKIRSLANAK